jgi:hypothetical protein
VNERAYDQYAAPARTAKMPRSDQRICHLWFLRKMIESGVKSECQSWFRATALVATLTVGPSGVAVLASGVHDEVQREADELVHGHPKDGDGDVVERLGEGRLSLVVDPGCQLAS